MKQSPAETKIVYKDRIVKVKCIDAPIIESVTMLKWQPTVVIDERDTWIGSTVKDYENMALNLQSLLRYIKGQNSIISYYEKCNL